MYDWRSSLLEKTRGLNLVLLGKIGAGKSASGNTILGRQAFESKESFTSVTQDLAVVSGTVCGRRVTVYDTPGLFNTKLSEEKVLQIYANVLQRCESGPCVFLLVIKADRFTERERKTVEKIEEILGENRLKKTLILFTRGDQLVEENMTIDAFINGTEALKILVQKYDQRYHVFNNKKKGPNGQVPELLKKIDAIEQEATSKQMVELMEREHASLSSPFLSALSYPGHPITHAQEQEATRKQMHVYPPLPLARPWSSSQFLSALSYPGHPITHAQEQEATSKQMQEMLESEHARPWSSSPFLSALSYPGHPITHAQEQRAFQKQTRILQRRLANLRSGRSARSVTTKWSDEPEEYMKIHKSPFDVPVMHLTSTDLEQRALQKQIGLLQRTLANLRSGRSARSVTTKWSDEPDEYMKIHKSPFDVPVMHLTSTDSASPFLSALSYPGHPITHAQGRIPRKLVAPGEPDTSRRIVLLGQTGVGKSASGNTILGQKEFRSVMSASSVTSVCSEAHTTVSGRSVSVVDTPGFFHTEMNPEQLVTEIARSVYISSPGPHAFLIVFNLTMRFTEHDLQILEQIKTLFGEEVLKYSMILFTRGDLLEEESVEKFIKESSKLRHLIGQCGGRYHIFNNEDQNNREQVNDLLQKIDTLNGERHYSNEMFEDAQRKRRVEKQRQEIERVIKETEGGSEQSLKVHQDFC